MKTETKSPNQDTNPTSREQPDPIDRHVGVRLRFRRIELGLSQGQVAAQLGLTFQQVQKYENGMNRIAASRMYEISRLLQVSIQYFYDDLPAELSNRLHFVSVKEVGGKVDGHNTVDTTGAASPLSEDVRTLVQTYYRITGPAKRKQVLDLLKSLATPVGGSV